MRKEEPAVWIIRAGRFNELDSLFLKGKFIALGWSKIGNLKKISRDRKIISLQIMKLYPNEKPGAIRGVAGKLLRFANEMAIDDLVVYPSKINRQIYIGQIIGGYKYDPTIKHEFAHLRPVRWIRIVPRKNFSTQALAEIGSILALFKINKSANEFRKAAINVDLPAFTG